MRIVNITCDYGQLKKEVLPKLRESVFHVTSGAAFDGIQQCGEVTSNIDGRFEFTFGQSKNSFGRNRGYVCLFDIRGKSDFIVDETLMRFYFLNPKGWDTVVFLVLNLTADDVLISNNRAKEEAASGEMWIPDTEVWFPAPLLLNKIAHVVKVDILNMPGDFRDDLIQFDSVSK